MGNRKRYKTPEEAFENRTQYEPNSGCLIWLGGLVHNGYGQLGIGNRKMMRAHRFAWEQENGPIPDGLKVLHKCDNRVCCNAEHLFPGTQQDNIADRDAKGRQSKPKGEANGSAKLKETDVRLIRGDGRSLHKIAADYGIGTSQISRIKRFENWKHA